MTTLKQHEPAIQHTVATTTHITADAMASVVDERDSKALWKALALVGVIAACIVIVSVTPLGQLLEPNLLKAHHWVERFGVGTTAVGFVVLGAIGIAIAVPRILFAAAAGVLFERIWLALIVAQLATVLGCWINFSYARALGRDFVAKRLGQRFRGLTRVLEFIHRHGVTGNILVRSLPVGHCFTLNLLMAMSPVGAVTFLIGTAVGTIPSTVIYVLLGNSAREQSALKIGLSLGLMVLWCVPYWFWMRRRRAQQQAAPRG